MPFLVPVVSIQEIEIIHSNFDGDKGHHKGTHVIIDDFHISKPSLKQLAINDGFVSENEFFEFFSSDFKGKIIHWTNLKY